MSVFLRKGTGRWAPSATSAVKHAYVSKRFQEGSANHMPWPFDKYKMPGAAKKWLSKYPVAGEEFEEEFVYLDEIEDRVNSHYKKQRQSSRYREAENQFGALGDYDDVDRVYPTLGEKDTTYGRGNLINPAHYMGPQFLTHSRIYVPNEKITPRHMYRNQGEIGRMNALPPEPDSLFRFWNFWHMFGAMFVITVGKEILIFSSHDTHHFFMYYITTGWAGATFVDWFLWWKALRGQEFYDHRFFPLQENVDNLFKLLDRLEKKPDLGIVTKQYHSYLDDLRQRLVARKVTDSVAEKASSVLSQLESKATSEGIEAGKPQRQWVVSAMEKTMSHFDSDAQKQSYAKSAMAHFLKEGAKLGEGQNPSNVVSTFYDKTYAQVEKQWFADHRKNGTLPWTHATEAEKKAGKLSAADQKSVYDAQIASFAEKYHRFA